MCTYNRFRGAVSRTDKYAAKKSQCSVVACRCNANVGKLVESTLIRDKNYKIVANAIVLLR